MSPSVEAYTSVVNGFAVKADVDGAFRILNLMKQQRILPNSYTLTSLMSACLSAKKIMKAKLLMNDEKLFQLLEYRLTTRDKVALYGAYSIGLCQLHNQLWDRRGDSIDSLLHHQYDSNVIKLRDVYLYEAQLSLIGMERQGLTPDVATMNAFIQSLCVQHPSRVIDALTLIPAMQAVGIPPDKFTYSILFTALGKYGYLNETLALFRTIDTSSRSTSISSSSRGISSSSRSSSINSIATVLDTSAFNSLLRSFVSGSSPLDCIKLFHHLTNKNDSIGVIEDFVPDKITFTILFLSIVKHLSSSSSSSDEDDDASRGGPFGRSSTHYRDDDDDYSQLGSSYDATSSSSSSSVPLNSGRIIKLNVSSPLLKVYQRLAITDLQLPTDNEDGGDDDGTHQHDDDVPVSSSSTGRRGGVMYNQPTISSQLDSYLNSKREADGQQQLKALSSSSSSSSTMNIDRVLLKLYKSMREHYAINPDVMMVKTISSLFSSNKQQRSGSGSGSIFDVIDISSSNNNKRISTDTARYMFEDLVILGVHPTEVRGRRGSR